VKESGVVVARLAGIRWEKAVMSALWGLAAIGCLLGIADPPSLGEHATHGGELLDLARVLTTTALAITLLLGPGTVWRALGSRRIALALVPLPGLALLTLTGLVAWLLAGSVDVKLTCFAILGPALGLMLGVLAPLEEDLFDAEEQRTLAVASIALGLGIARSLWSLGPQGELYEGGISRTLQAEGRPDSRTSYLVTELLANGQGPYAKDGGELLFIPYNFSSRGPVPGIASAPIVLMSGARPAPGAPEYPWQPFDGQGFMAFRIAMMTFSCTALLALWQLVRKVGGARAARFALLLAVSTPFFLADLTFTWPKLLAAAFILIAGLMVLERRPFRGGLSFSAGFLIHPGALVGLLSVGPYAFWPPTRPRFRWPNWVRPRILAVILLAIGTAIGVEFWKIYNGSHYFQSGFLEYVQWASVYHLHPSAWQWIEYRLVGLGGTLVPLFTPILRPHSIFNNQIFGTSPGVIHFFDQYWDSLSFGLGIFFYPLVLVSLWRAGRRWPWPILATVVLPFLAFAVYWGASDTGYLREGLQYWALLVLGVIALEQAARGFPWLRSIPVRLILCVRAVEVFAVMVGSTWGTRGLVLASGRFTLDDLVAFVLMVGLVLGLIRLIWTETGSGLGEAADARARPDPS
jgi:hypothetical protein